MPAREPTPWPGGLKDLMQDMLHQTAQDLLHAALPAVVLSCVRCGAPWTVESVFCRACVVWSCPSCSHKD